jgi:hypothetical protein
MQVDTYKSNCFCNNYSFHEIFCLKAIDEDFTYNITYQGRFKNITQRNPRKKSMQGGQCCSNKLGSLGSWQDIQA